MLNLILNCFKNVECLHIINEDLHINFDTLNQQLQNNINNLKIVCDWGYYDIDIFTRIKCFINLQSIIVEFTS